MSNKIKVKIDSNHIFTYEQIEHLFKQTENTFLEIVPVDLNKDSDIKLKLFKHGFKWVYEDNVNTVYLDKEKLIKYNLWAKWIRLNPNTLSMDKDYKELIAACLECFSDDFKVWLNESQLSIKETLKLI